MSLGTLGSFNGAVTPDINMLDIFRSKELERYPDSALNFSRMTIKKIGIKCEPGTSITINGSKIPVVSGVFELGYGLIDITSLVFDEAAEVNIYYLY